MKSCRDCEQTCRIGIILRAIDELTEFENGGSMIDEMGLLCNGHSAKKGA